MLWYVPSLPFSLPWEERSGGEGIKLIVGLGNPGPRYANTRHNVGFRCLDALARRHSLARAQGKREASLAVGKIGEVSVILAKPLTFMNRSGDAVRELLARYGLGPADLLIIYDDVDLPLGKLRLRPRGSAAGHHGLESIVQQLATDEFARLRVGIGRPATNDVYEYVLSDFLTEEETVIREACERAADMVDCLLAEGLEVAMNQQHRF